MGKKSLAPNRQCRTEFKIGAVRLAESVGGNEAAKRLGIPDSSIWNWIRRSRAGKLDAGATVATAATAATAVKRPQGELEAENSRLRRELANAKLDLEIVKKAAAFFARESR